MEYITINAVITGNFLSLRITDTSVKCKGDGTTSLWRRYSEFELLKNYLEITYPALVVPPLPEKKASAHLPVISSLSLLCVKEEMSISDHKRSCEVITFAE